MPELAATQLVKEGKLIKLGTLQGVFMDFYLIYVKRVIENPALNLLIEQNFNKVKLAR